ncbi:MAG TPA: hypothetical protein VM183_01225 [Burkholderiales bacterium]|nr:hypothetical protein [Burkholderiales bacterium]
MASNVQSRALLRAAELAGGRDCLALLLEVERPLIDEWIAGRTRPGMPMMLRVVALILDEIEEQQD